MRVKTDPVNDPAEIILNSEVYPACKGCYSDDSCNVYQPRCERIIAHRSFSFAVQALSGEITADPCNGCRNFNYCKTNKVACERFNAYVQERPRDWWNYSDYPSEERYDHLFPRDPISEMRMRERSLYNNGWS